MKNKLISNHITMPRTLVDLIDENAPKSRSKFIITLIDSFYQHKTEKSDLSEFNDPEDLRVSFTLRLPPAAQERLMDLALLRFRDKNNMLTALCATELSLRD